MLRLKLKRLAALGLLLVCTGLLAGCGKYNEEIKQINSGVEALSTVQNGHLLMTAQTQAEQGLVQGYDSAYCYDYRYRIDVRTFNFVVEKRYLPTELLIEPPYKVIDAHKYDLETGVEDEEYAGKIGDFPDLLSFFFKAGLKSGYVGEVEALTDADHPDWQGWRVHKNDKYISRANKSRSKDGADGLMLENYVDYWLNKDGLLVRMDYFSRDSIIVDEVSDTISQLYVFELLDYNKEEIADF